MTSLAERIRTGYAEGADLAPLLKEAEAQGISLTVRMRRVTINLREGYSTDEEGETLTKHPLDVAAGLEEKETG